MPKQLESVDVLIIGAGLSGIGSACQLRRNCPDRTFAIFESRTNIGGTWDLFRYPGIRSDSDMYTFSYGFKPWRDASSVADGAKIRRYIQETAAEKTSRGISIISIRSSRRTGLPLTSIGQSPP